MLHFKNGHNDRPPRQRFCFCFDQTRAHLLLVATLGAVSQTESCRLLRRTRANARVRENPGTFLGGPRGRQVLLAHSPKI